MHTPEIYIPGRLLNGWMGTDELYWLHEKAKEMSSCLEIGSWAGRSTTALLEGCKGLVYAVDHFQGSPEHKKTIEDGFKPYEEFYKNCGGFRNLRLFPMTSAQAFESPLIPYGIDFIFIDGAHEFPDVMEDVRLWTPRATRMICGHDRNEPGVREALAKQFGEGEVQDGPGSIWYVVREKVCQLEAVCRRVGEPTMM